MTSNNFKQTQSLSGGLMFSFYLFRKYFFSSRGVSLIRTVFWVCLGGITVSVAALILIVSIMGGFGQSIMKRHLAGEPHLVSDLKQNPFQNQILLKKTLPKSLRQGIKSTVFYETQDVIIKTKEGFSGAMARGYSLQKWKEKRLTTMDWSPSLSKKMYPLPKGTDKSQSLLSELLITQKLSLDLNIFKGDELLLIPAVALLLPPGESLPLRRMKVAGVLAEPETSAQSAEQNLMIFYKQGKVDFGAFSKPKYGAEIKLQDPSTGFFI